MKAKIKKIGIGILFMLLMQVIIVTKSSAQDVLMHTGTDTTCSGYFYDSGGPSGVYANMENYTLTIVPPTSGSKVRLTFNSFATESGYDYLTIYDGLTTSSPTIGTYNGTVAIGTVTSTDPSGALTMRFTSDYL